LRRRSRVSERSDLACKAIPCLQRHMRCRHERHHGSDHGSRNQLGVESFWLPFGMDGYDQSNAMPPSTRRLIPVTKLLESVARKSAAWASSAGWPSRLSGMALAILAANASRSSSGAPSFSSIAVSVGPGLNMLTRILRSLSSRAQLFAKAPIAALVPA